MKNYINNKIKKNKKKVKMRKLTSAANNTAKKKHNLQKTIKKEHHIMRSLLIKSVNKKISKDSISGSKKVYLKNLSMHKDYIRKLRFKENKLLPSPSPRNSDYLKRLTTIKMKRFEWIEIIMAISKRYSLNDNVIFLSVNIMDRFLSIENKVGKTGIIRLLLTSILIASKYCNSNHISIKKLISYNECVLKFTLIDRESIIAFEFLILDRLQFNITVVTEVEFIDYFLKVIRDNNLLKDVESLSDKVRKYSKLVLSDEFSLDNSPFNIASAVLIISLKHLDEYENIKLQRLYNDYFYFTKTNSIVKKVENIINKIN